MFKQELKKHEGEHPRYKSCDEVVFRNQSGWPKVITADGNKSHNSGPKTVTASNSVISHNLFLLAATQ